MVNCTCTVNWTNNILQNLLSRGGMACAQTADPNMVCSTSAIPTFSVRKILTLSRATDTASGTLWRVPVFQRRYCWGKPQLQKLLLDILALCPCPAASAGTLKTHELGRLVVATDSTGAAVVVDGHQRITTICIFISSIRDHLSSVVQSASSVALPMLHATIGACNGIISPHGNPVLQPTFFDRDSFYCCLDATICNMTAYDAAMKAA